MVDMDTLGALDWLRMTAEDSGRYHHAEICKQIRCDVEELIGAIERNGLTVLKCDACHKPAAFQTGWNQIAICDWCLKNNPAVMSAEAVQRKLDERGIDTTEATARVLRAVDEHGNTEEKNDGKG